MSTPRPTEPPIQAESVVLRLRRHGRALTLPVLILAALAVAAGFWVGALPEAWMNLAAAGGAAALALLLGVGPVLSWLTRRTIITNRRVIARSGVFVQHRSEVPLSRVREVRSRRTLVQRMFGSGDIELVGGAGGVGGSTVLRDVPGFDAVADALQELVEQDFTRAQANASGRVPGSPAPQVSFGQGDTVSIPR
ncbi:PH domain-containing protein [Leucobacter sp. Z1108]|uniref:PH domain-containing protein n=1 Tax=Leucobacter sp. Z1108 TaxID=3439066 RepID=UPI003F39B145